MIDYLEELLKSRDGLYTAGLPTLWDGTSAPAATNHRAGPALAGMPGAAGLGARRKTGGALHAEIEEPDAANSHYEKTDSAEKTMTVLRLLTELKRLNPAPAARKEDGGGSSSKAQDRILKAMEPGVAGTIERRGGFDAGPEQAVRYAENTMRELSDFFERDARRYPGAFDTY